MTRSNLWRKQNIYFTNHTYSDSVFSILIFKIVLQQWLDTSIIRIIQVQTTVHVQKKSDISLHRHINEKSKLQGIVIEHFTLNYPTAVATSDWWHSLLESEREFAIWEASRHKFVCWISRHPIGWRVPRTCPIEARLQSTDSESCWVVDMDEVKLSSFLKIHLFACQVLP